MRICSQLTRNRPPRILKPWCLVAWLGLLPAITTAGEVETWRAAAESIRIQDLKKHAGLLSSDTLEGREAGTRGGRAAGAYLADQLRRLQLQGGGLDGDYYQEFGNNFRNVLGLLPGRDPVLKNEWIIVGAHYDHVGYGNQRNSLGPIGYIHNGADDNASGTSGLLEVAEAFTKLESPPRRSILFAFWDAEEMGLLGSQHWVAYPTVPLQNVRLLLNIDMIGRLRDRTLSIYGCRTAIGLRRLVCQQNRQTDLLLDFNWNIRNDSDHYPFYQRQIPFLMPFTRKHEDYHRPTDDFDKLNFDGLQDISRLVFGILQAAANQRELPGFRPASQNENEALHQQLASPAPDPPSRLGISYQGPPVENDVVTVVSVAPQSPADRAGLRVGDRVLEFAHYQTNKIEDFRSLVLMAQNPVPVVIERNGLQEPMELAITLNGRPLRLGITWRRDNTQPDCVILKRVLPGSPAAGAGLQVNDRIYQVDGQDFSTEEGFRKLIAARGSQLPLLVERRGRIRNVTLKLPPARTSQRTADK